MTAATIRIVVADDHPSVRRGLAALLAGEPDMACVGQASDAQEMLALCLSLRPDVLVSDLRMPGLPATEAIEEITRELPATRAVVLTTFLTEDSVLRTLQAGARAYLLKTASDEELLGAIRAVHAGQRVVPLEVADRLADAALRPALTAREQDVLAELAKGRTTKAIARSLGISPGTVRSHLEHIFDKLDCRDRTAAVIVAQRRGLLNSAE
jgi:two-component system NarL family response regulator